MKMNNKQWFDKNIKYVVGIGILLAIIFAIFGGSFFSWFMPTKYVKVTDTSIEYYVGVSGNCWTTSLKDPSGNTINTQSGCSYGTHSFPRPTTTGTYNICILPDYKPSSYVECEPVYVLSKTCLDGTLYSSCSTIKPKYCDNGNLIDKASQCGCSLGLIVNGDDCVVPQPIVESPLMSINDIIMLIWDWIKGFLGLSMIGAETINVGAGQQSYVITVTSPEAPDNVYADKTYSELYGTWFVVDSNQNVIAQKGGWTKLSSSIYNDNVLVTFSNTGSYSVVGVIVKIPYTYGTSWVKGTETIVAKEQMKVTVSMPAPTGGIPSISISDIISNILNWIKSLFGL